MRLAPSMCLVRRVVVTGQVLAFTAVGCAPEPTAAQDTDVASVFHQVTGEDSREILVPPPGFPTSDDAYVTEVGDGRSKITRSADGAVARFVLKGQTPGHVLVYATLAFNYPEHCVEGEDRLPEPGPCTGNGPTDPRDGLIPEALLSVNMWANTVVSHLGQASFTVDLTNDVALWTSPINGGPGLVNPLGAVIFVTVLDKGPLAPEGALRNAQLNTLFGGCAGPPAFGPLACRNVGLVQHLP